MSKEMEQKLKTQFQFNDIFIGERIEEFEHQVMDPQNLQREVETIRNRESIIRGLRAAIYYQALPVQQVQQTVRVAEPQPTAVAAAPQEESWKERRAKRKKKEKNLKRGKKLTQYGDELTADLVETQQAMDEDIRVFRDNGYSRSDVSEELMDVLRSMQGVKVTAEMFTDESYVGNYAFLRETLEKGRYLARIAGSDDLMNQLRQQDINLYGTALYWKDAVSVVEQMMTFTNITHGLDRNARVIENPQGGIKHTDPLKRPEAIGKAREKIGGIRDQFRSAMATIEQTHMEAMKGELQAEFEQELVRQKSVVLMDSAEEVRTWMDSASLVYGSPEAYEDIEKLKTLIEGSNELYLANKDVVDRIYSDIIRRYEVLGELTAQRYAWIELQSKYQGHRPGSDGDKLWRTANGKLDQLIKDGTDVAENLTTIRNALTRLLSGALFNPLEVAALESYGYHAEEDMKVATASLREQATARAVRSKWQNKKLQKLLGTEKNPGIFRPADPNSQYVTRAVTLFEQEDEGYNLELLETLQIFEKELNRKRPEQAEGMSDGAFEKLQREDMAHRREYYDKIRDIVEPQVTRIMNWEMDRFLQMSDEELIGAQKELDDLFGANMFTSDLMKLKHPKLDSWQMKDDILGDRLEEFSHRLSILRALTDKSRGLALSRLGALTILKPADFGTDAAYGKLGDGSHESCLAFAKKQVEASERMLKNEQARWEDKRDIHSEAFQTACMEKHKKKGTSKNIPDPDSPLDAVQARFIRHAWELQPDATQDEKDVRKRLMGEKYRIACWDLEDAKRYAREKGVDPDTVRQKDLIDDMGEPIFRVFSAYIRSIGAQTQSPEEFEQMLQDLSAGAELQRGVSSDEEIFEAREKNRQGALQFKESLRVSYEYLSRKYGFGLETLTPLEIYDHWEEILGDFGNVQVEMNFINRIPDMVDMENQEDKALYHQINYLSVMSQAVQNLLILVGSGQPVDEVMELIRHAAVNEVGGPDREALREMGEASGMTQTVRWEQKPGQRRSIPPEDPEAREARWQKFQRDEEARREEQRRAEEQRVEEQRLKFEEEFIYEVEMLDELEDTVRVRWKDMNINYPDQHTGRLYQARRDEEKAYQSKRAVALKVMKKPLPNMEQQNALLALLPAFQLNEKGELSSGDRKTVEKMTKDFFYGKQVAKNAVMDQMVETVCRLEFTSEMFTPAYIRDHFEEMKGLSRQLTAMGFLQKMVPAYFEQMDPQLKQLWDGIYSFRGMASLWVDNTLLISGLGPTEESLVGAEPATEEEYMELRDAQEEDMQTLLTLWREDRANWQVEEEWQKEPEKVTVRVTEKLNTLSFDRFPQRTEGMQNGKTRFVSGWHRRDGMEKGEYMAPSEHVGMAKRVIPKFEDQKRYGDAMSGGALGDLGNATGTSFSGLKATRLLSNLEGALGQGCTEEQIISMYEKLTATGRYRWLKNGEELKTLTAEEQQELRDYDAMKVKTMNDTFAEGIQELKQIQLAQLRRIRDKYGRFGSQLHPEDFASRMGLEFFDDFMLDQDMVQVLKYGEQYFDFENNAEDREFRDLVNYYSNVFNILFAYFSVPEDQYDYAMAHIIPNLRENQKARELEDIVGGDGFTVQEQMAYRQDLAKRAGEKGIHLFGRFQENS